MAKQELLKEFQNIKEILNEMVTRNMNGPENEKVDFVDFYLDTGNYNRKKLKNKRECKEMEIHMKALIIAQDKVTVYLKRTYLLPMGVIGKIIRGIFQKTMATNYVLLPQDEKRLRQLKWIEELRKVEQCMSNTATFQPWLKLTQT